MAQNLKKISKIIFIISIFVYVISPDKFDNENTIQLSASISHP